MFGMSMPHLLLAGAVILLLFGGKGKVSDLMGDFAKGIKSFKKGLSDEDEAKPVSSTPVPPVADPLRTIDHRTTTPVDHRASTPVDASGENRRVG